MQAIEAIGLTKRFIGRTAHPARALDCFDLRVRPGCTLAVVGGNGAGKSTLFGVLGGLLRPSSGFVSIRGLTPVENARWRGVGLLPDRMRLPSRTRVRDLMLRLAALEGLVGRDRAVRVDAALDRLGLGDRSRDRCGSLSRGLRQRLGIAQLLLAPRQLMLLDEPWSGLDPMWRAALREILDSLRCSAPEAVILVSSHELAEAARVADRVIVIDRGRRVDDLSAVGDAERLERRVLAALASPSRP